MLVHLIETKSNKYQRGEGSLSTKAPLTKDYILNHAGGSEGVLPRLLGLQDQRWAMLAS